MRNLMLSLVLIFPLSVFGQNLKDIVNFDSLNKDLINNELINLIIKERKVKQAVSLVKDTIPMFAAKYHTMYFERYGDDSQIHAKDSSIVYDLYGRGYMVESESPTPLSRVRMAEFVIETPDSLGLYEYNHKLVSEVSKFYKIQKDLNITYETLINNIFEDFIETKNGNILVNDFTNESKHLGIASGLYKDNNDEIVLTSTYVLTTYEK